MNEAHLNYCSQLPYRCCYAHRRLARLGSPRSWSPQGRNAITLGSPWWYRWGTRGSPRSRNAFAQPALRQFRRIRWTRSE